jgi:hypothetical protein
MFRFPIDCLLYQEIYLRQESERKVCIYIPLRPKVGYSPPHHIHPSSNIA